MSWCRHSAITLICNRITPSPPFQQPFSTTAPLHKKFKPQELYLLPGQPKARKSKVPKKVLKWRAERAGLSQAEENVSEPVAIFAEETELYRSSRRQDDESAFGLKKSWVSRTAARQEDHRGDRVRSFGLGRRAQDTDRSSQFSEKLGETHMAQRIRETRAGLVDPSAPISTSPPVHPETVIPSWKIPTPSEYESVAYRRAKYQSKPHKEDSRKRATEQRGTASPVGRSGATSLSSARRSQMVRNTPADGAKSDANRDWSQARVPDVSSTDGIYPPPERSSGRWEPTKKLSIPTMRGLRALHQSDPKTFSHAVLSEKFGVSREAVARIIRSKFRDEQR
ncbi:hypothetical protein NliqN6_6730 [Naganishia liquefaciens]|uniref:Required for respiratory growth protein 9, mitochondrial n=1 Tax=Naganishia liquefaciens TaxID=104408 RepID=A0A8H3U079_9TREE|nr:hypothetical protein NliqN6_6730 [Naganishia liquefaciens]